MAFPAKKIVWAFRSVVLLGAFVACASPEGSELMQESAASNSSSPYTCTSAPVILGFSRAPIEKLAFKNASLDAKAKQDYWPIVLVRDETNHVYIYARHGRNEEAYPSFSGDVSMTNPLVNQVFWREFEQLRSQNRQAPFDILYDRSQIIPLIFEDLKDAASPLPIDNVAAFMTKAGQQIFSESYLSSPRIKNNITTNTINVTKTEEAQRSYITALSWLASLDTWNAKQHVFNENVAKHLLQKDATMGTELGRRIAERLDQATAQNPKTSADPVDVSPVICGNAPGSTREYCTQKIAGAVCWEVLRDNIDDRFSINKLQCSFLGTVSFGGVQGQESKIRESWTWSLKKEYPFKTSQ